MEEGKKEITYKDLTIIIDATRQRIEFDVADMYKKIPQLAPIYKSSISDKCNPDDNYLYPISEKDGFKIVEIPNESAFYKGMHTFINLDFEEKFKSKSSKNEAYWFGDKYIATTYAIMFNGGVNAYLTTRKLNLMLVTLDNIRKIFRIIDSLSDPNVKKALYEVFYAKYGGVDQPDYESEEALIKHTYFLKTYLHSENTWYHNPTIHVSSINFCNDDEIQQKYKPFPNIFGSSRIDRDCYWFLIIICQILGLDGVFSHQSHSVYFLDGVAHGETVIYDQNLLKRNIKDPMDWINWPAKYFPVSKSIFESDTFLLNPSFRNKNFDQRVVKYYIENNTDSSFKLDIIKSKFSIGTLNVHYFESINILDSTEMCLNGVIKLMENLDVLCLQEVNEKSYHQLRKILGSNIQMSRIISGILNNIIITRKPCHFNSFYYDQSDPITRTGKRRHVVICEINHITIANTHLEIISSPKNSEDDKEKSQQIRLLEVKELISKNYDIIVGDMNFTPDDKEFKLISNKYMTAELLPTNPFNTKTDYIFVKKDASIIISEQKILKYKYSDHNPVIAFLKD